MFKVDRPMGHIGYPIDSTLSPQSNMSRREDAIRPPVLIRHIETFKSEDMVSPYNEPVKQN